VKNYFARRHGVNRGANQIVVVWQEFRFGGDAKPGALVVGVPANHLYSERQFGLQPVNSRKYGLKFTHWLKIIIKSSYHLYCI